MTSTQYDALTLEIERAESLTGLLEDGLADLAEGDEQRKELYALSMVAMAITDKLRLIRRNALALHASAGKRAKKAGEK